MDNIKVSVIVPIYNSEKYIKQCLNSILNQTLKEIEIICVNDGSTDSSPKILQEYSTKDTRIRVITKENDGLGAARNTGIRIAKGEYIGFVDSDDFIDVNYFYFLYQNAIKTGADVVLGNINLFFNDTGIEQKFRDCLDYDKSFHQTAFSVKQLPEILLRIGVWDRIYRKDYLLENNLLNPEHIIYEDALFSFQTSILASKISLCPDAIYKYRKNTGIAITDEEIINDGYKFDFLKNGVSIKKFLHSLGVYKDFFPYFLKYFIENALWHQSNFIDYIYFKQFWEGVLEIVNTQEMLYIIKKKQYCWKSKIYAFLLFINCPKICYSLFWKKRINR